MASPNPRKKAALSAKAIADAASCYCGFILVALVVLSIFRDSSLVQTNHSHHHVISFKGNHLFSRPCDEIYVVGEGETLHTISDKCGDPFIVENNPHIHDPDDVFPGLLIKITPQKSS